MRKYGRYGGYYAKYPNYDAGKLNALFKDLRKQRLIARQNFSCCSGCAGAELAEYYGEKCQDLPDRGARIKGVVFYHRQDAEGLRAKGGCYLRYGDISYYGSDKEPKFKSPLSTVEVGKMVVAACERADIHCEWDGKPETCIWIDTLKPFHEPPPEFLGEGI